MRCPATSFPFSQTRLVISSTSRSWTYPVRPVAVPSWSRGGLPPARGFRGTHCVPRANPRATGYACIGFGSCYRVCLVCACVCAYADNALQALPEHLTELPNLKKVVLAGNPICSWPPAVVRWVHEKGIDVDVEVPPLPESQWANWLGTAAWSIGTLEEVSVATHAPGSPCFVTSVHGSQTGCRRPCSSCFKCI